MIFNFPTQANISNGIHWNGIKVEAHMRNSSSVSKMDKDIQTLESKADHPAEATK